MPNRLASAVSPYLRSHAGNPVDWWEWGAEPFAEAARRDVPVLVSIGYSTCHWCHVMARESFSDASLAAFLNDNFVAIKVDREEHQDVDSTYMAAAGAFTPNLGWPLNVFLTPDGRAFFAGTYWPPVAVQGHPAFRDVLEAVLDAWFERRHEVESNAATIANALVATRAHGTGDLPHEGELAVAVTELLEYEDKQHGGFGGAPKFPVSPVLKFLLDRGSLGDEAAQSLAERTLDAMAASDLRDPVEGGFFRYSTMRDWTDPHYERMLCDNAQLLAAYARIGRVEVATGIADYLITVLQQPSGGFASAQDSESTVDGKRVEGFYYSLDAASRAALDPPPLDDKILTGWNGLAIEGLSVAGSLLGRRDWIESAQRAADYLIEKHLGDRVVRASIGDSVSAASATLEDFGMLASGLLQLALSSGEVRYANVARQLVNASLAAGTTTPFGVPGGSDPVLAAHGLALDPDPSDGAYPSGVSAMAAASNRLYLLTAHAPYRQASEVAMKQIAPIAIQRAVSFGAALSVMVALDAPVAQLVIVTDDESELAATARSWKRAGAAIAVVSSAATSAFAEAGFELFEGRTAVNDSPTAYLCEDFVCRLPITDAGELAARLNDAYTPRD